MVLFFKLLFKLQLNNYFFSYSALQNFLTHSQNPFLYKGMKFASMIIEIFCTIVFFYKECNKYTYVFHMYKFYKVSVQYIKEKGKIITGICM